MGIKHRALYQVKRKIADKPETVGGKLCLCQTGLVIERCRGLSASRSLRVLGFMQRILSYSPYGAEGRRLQESLIRSLGFSEHYGRRRGIDRCEIADWKTLPFGDN